MSIHAIGAPALILAVSHGMAQACDAIRARTAVHGSCALSTKATPNAPAHEGVALAFALTGLVRLAQNSDDQSGMLAVKIELPLHHGTRWFYSGTTTTRHLRLQAKGLHFHSGSRGVVVKVGADGLFIGDPHRVPEVLRGRHDAQDEPARLARQCPGGISVGSTTQEYELTWQGQSGYKTLRFTNGIGVTGATLDHGPSGTASELTLVGYDLGNKQATNPVLH